MFHLPAFLKLFFLLLFYRTKRQQKEAGGYGKSLKEDYRFFYGAGVGMAGRGEAVPRADNLCEIDPNVVDKYGIPVLRFNVKWSDYEVNQAKHMKETFKEIMHNMGAVITWGGDDTEKNDFRLSIWGKFTVYEFTICSSSPSRPSRGEGKQPHSYWLK